MKKLKNWLVCLVLAVCCFSFVACGDKNNVNLNQKPNVSIEGDFEQTEVAQLSTTFGTKEAVVVENFDRYQVYMAMELENYSQTTNMAFELDENGMVQSMAMKMSITAKSSSLEVNSLDATCYYKDSVFYIDTNVAGFSLKCKFDMAKVAASGNDDYAEFTDMLKEMNITALLSDLFDTMQNNEYFNFEKTEDNTKFKVSKKADTTLPEEMDCTDVSIEIELAENKLSQMKCNVTSASESLEILLTKTDKQIKYPKSSSYIDITNELIAG